MVVRSRHVPCVLRTLPAGPAGPVPGGSRGHPPAPRRSGGSPRGSGDSPRLANSAHGEEGSEVVAHVLTQALVVLVVLAVLQAAFALHTRNLAISAAGEGARRGALLGSSDAEARARTGELLDEALGSSRPRTVTTSREVRAGRETLVVTVSTALPVLLTWGPAGWLTVRGRSVVEVGDVP
ncbi:ABC transporter [Actinomyces polynesiensis]|uniref:ABC transporter n=1 Tax=Actinomyces polynesiensis TaxID=1325934 RepID=UPI002F3E7E1F